MRIIIAVLFVLSASLSAGAATPVDWTDLKDPHATAFEDPFETLGIRQLRSLATVVQVRKALADNSVSGDVRRRYQERLNRAEALLAASGVDTEHLLAQREDIALKRAKAALSGNPDLDGQEITISGFVIPVQNANGDAALGYLVPEYGMCSHIPPPDPNQMIRYTLTTDWRAGQLYQPVLLTGRLALNQSRVPISLVDGYVEMIASFDMDVTDVRPLDGAQIGGPSLPVFTAPGSHFQMPGTN